MFDVAMAVKGIRKKLASGEASIGSWMQLPSSSVAEIMGASNFDWVAVDLEHGNFSYSQITDICRALELGGTVPLARIADTSAATCKNLLDAGFAGLIAADIQDAAQIQQVVKDSCWPPAGTRGVGFSRANLYGARFERYKEQAQMPLIVPMIESSNGVENLNEILGVPGLDAVFVGPYDLSASLGDVANFQSKIFEASMSAIFEGCKKAAVPVGMHVVAPDQDALQARIRDGYQFIAFSIDAVFLQSSAKVYPPA